MNGNGDFPGRLVEELQVLAAETNERMVREVADQGLPRAPVPSADPAGERLSVVMRQGSFVPVSHGLLMDSASHECGPDCPPVPDPQPKPAWLAETRFRLRSRFHRYWWAVRHVHGVPDRAPVRDRRRRMTRDLSAALPGRLSAGLGMALASTIFGQSHRAAVAEAVAVEIQMGRLRAVCPDAEPFDRACAEAGRLIAEDREMARASVYPPVPASAILRMVVLEVCEFGRVLTADQRQARTVAGVLGMSWEPE